MQDTEFKAFMRDIDNDDIDKSLWLSKKGEYFDDLMARRTDIQECNGRYFCPTEFAFDQLYTKQVLPRGESIIDANQLRAAEFYVTLRIVALRRLGYSKMQTIIQDFHGAEIGRDFCASTAVKDINQELIPWQLALIERLCFQPIRDNDWAWMINLSHRIQQSFDNLSDIIEIAVDKQKMSPNN